LYESPITFLPMFTLLIAANYRPTLPDDDDATWERVVEIPFTVQIPEAERDPSLRNELRDPKVSGAAILNWMLSGCQLYQNEGLVAPEQVKQATGDYKKAMDPLVGFFEDELVFSQDGTTRAKDLRAAYEAWCGQNGKRPVDAKRMARGLEQRGCRKERPTIEGKQVRVWNGVQIAEPAEEKTAPEEDAKTPSQSFLGNFR